MSTACVTKQVSYNSKFLLFPLNGEACADPNPVAVPTFQVSGFLDTSLSTRPLNSPVTPIGAGVALLMGGMMGGFVSGSVLATKELAEGKRGLDFTPPLSGEEYQRRMTIQMRLSERLYPDFKRDVSPAILERIIEREMSAGDPILQKQEISEEELLQISRRLSAMYGIPLATIHANLNASLNHSGVTVLETASGNSTDAIVAMTDYLVMCYPTLELTQKTELKERKLLLAAEARALREKARAKKTEDNERAMALRKRVRTKVMLCKSLASEELSADSAKIQKALDALLNRSSDGEMIGNKLAIEQVVLLTRIAERNQAPRLSQALRELMDLIK